MSTDFANSRFALPWLVGITQWALFADGADMLALDDIKKVFDMADPQYAIMCVKHNYKPSASVKMDNQVQTQYNRKNWSSFMLWNTFHRAHCRLTLYDVNHRPGRELHGLFWLRDEEIGGLPEQWNHLVGTSEGAAPCVVHYTEGTPQLGYDGPWAAAWHAELDRLGATA